MLDFCVFQQTSFKFFMKNSFVFFQALGGDNRFKAHASLPRGEDGRHYHHHHQVQSSSSSHLQRVGTSDSPGKFSIRYWTPIVISKLFRSYEISGFPSLKSLWRLKSVIKFAFRPCSSIDNFISNHTISLLLKIILLKRALI